MGHYLERERESCMRRNTGRFISNNYLFVLCIMRECVQCLAATKKGSRCKNITCVYSEFCRVHTKQIFDLVLKPSQIPDSGTGLFTAVQIPKNKNIAKYTGQVKSQEEYNANPSGYAIAISRGRVIDAASTQDGIARYSNDCRTKNKKSGHCSGNNARFVVNHRNDTVWLRSTKNIPAGSEIFVSYGSGYW